MKMKKAGCRMHVVNGSKFVSAMWMRDLPTLNDLFKRLMFPFVRNSRGKALWFCTVLLALLFAPYPAAAGSYAAYYVYPEVPSLVLLLASTAAVTLHMASYAIQARAFGMSARKAYLAPVGGFAASVGFLDGLLAKNTSWRGRIIRPQEVSEG